MKRVTRSVQNSIYIISISHALKLTQIDEAWKIVLGELTNNAYSVLIISKKNSFKHDA